MRPAFDGRLAVALLGGLTILIAGWFMPLRPIIAGDEQVAEQRIPQTRNEVIAARAEFESVQQRYETYIRTHDLAALLARSRAAVDAARGSSGSAAPVLESVQQVSEFANVLLEYAQSSERYLGALRTYDDDLMSWTRGLAARSEQLRDKTWPVVEYLKNYPEPVGLKADPPAVSAADITEVIDRLSSDASALRSGAAGAALRSISKDIDDIWAAGRSVEYVAGLHSGYAATLSAYDENVQQAAATPEAGPTRLRAVVGGALTAALGLILWAGVSALLIRPWGPRA